MKKWVWTVGTTVVEDDGKEESKVSLEMGEVGNTFVADMDPDYARRIANALLSAADDVEKDRRVLH